jgi:hypothetical protein
MQSACNTNPLTVIKKSWIKVFSAFSYEITLVFNPPQTSISLLIFQMLAFFAICYTSLALHTSEI